MSPHRALAALFLIGASAAAPADGNAPRAWAGSIALPTWDEGLPDPLPHLSILGAEKAWYPYAVRTNFTKQKRVQRWRTLNLENQYLSCVVLPDLGGRVYRCRDKLSGYEMFHANPSIKKANIGQRGAWAAAGLELNFPVSHSLLTVSPVDFRVMQGPDSASVWVGATDRVTGMRWRVEFTLARGSAVLRQSVRFENPSGAPQRYSWWSNAGVTLRDDTRFVLPARQVGTHGLTRVENWPVGADGIDRSVPANYPASLGLFAHGPAEPWFAVFHGASKTGTLHFAEMAEMPGKKIWVWGKDQDQEIRAMLSDDGSQYVEMQAGLFENQETFGDLQPGHSRDFREYWIPVRGLAGITQASRDAVLYLAREGGALRVEVMATRALAGAKLSIGGTVQAVTLDPAKVLSATAPAPAGQVRVELRDAAGKLLLGYTEGEAGTSAGPAAGRSETVLEHEMVKQAAQARWAGDRAGAAAAVARAAALDPTDPLARFEQVRQGASDPELWTSLAADPVRVIDVADSYTEWGMYRDAAVALGYRYTPVPGNWMEPGAVMPQDYALLAYYRGYVHRKLGQYSAEDFRLASSLPVTYVFPSRASSRAVLEAALEANPGDPSAHYLLGLWQLHAGHREEGGRELQAANRLRPGLAEARTLLAAMKLPVVEPKPVSAPPARPEAAPKPKASAPPARPEAAPKPKASAPPARPEAAPKPTVTTPPARPPAEPGHPAGQAVATAPLEIALRALEEAGNGNLAGALRLFTGANFPADRQEDLVRQAYIELQLARLLDTAARGNCPEAARLLAGLGAEDKSLPFTFGSFDRFMKGARFQYELGVAEGKCLGEKTAAHRWERVARMRTAMDSPDYVYPLLALAALGRPVDAVSPELNLRRALDSAPAPARAVLLYNQGLLLTLQGKRDEAAASFRQGAEAAPPGVVRFWNRDILRRPLSR